MLRKHGVVGKFVEFYGDGLDLLPLADRATSLICRRIWRNLWFPSLLTPSPRIYAIKRTHATIWSSWLKPTRRRRECGVIPDEPAFTSTLNWIWAMSRPPAGPKRPAGSRGVRRCAESLAASAELELNNTAQRDRQPVDYTMNGQPYQLPMKVVIAAITSRRRIPESQRADGGGHGRKAVTLGLKRQPWSRPSSTGVKSGI